MSSPTPGPSKFNNYQVSSSDALSDTLWNEVLADVALRLKSVEDKATGYDNLVNAGIGVALDRINEGLAPAAAQISSIIAQLNAELSLLQTAGVSATLVEETDARKFVSPAMTAELADHASRIAAVEARLSRIGGRSFFLSTM